MTWCCTYSLYWYWSSYTWDWLQIHGKSSFSLTYIILYQLSDWGTSSSDCADGGRQWQWTEGLHGCCKYGFIWASRDSCKQPTLVAETIHEMTINDLRTRQVLAFSGDSLSEPACIHACVHACQWGLAGNVFVTENVRDSMGGWEWVHTLKPVLYRVSDLTAMVPATRQKSLHIITRCK